MCSTGTAPQSGPPVDRDELVGVEVPKLQSLPTGVCSRRRAVRLSMRELAQRIQLLDSQLLTINRRMRRVIQQIAPARVGITGVGPDVASTLLLTAGDNRHRIHSERSFAALCGNSPIPATSGKTQDRHRLNCGGDRQPNSVLWRITFVRLGHDQRTRDYLAKRMPARRRS